MPDERTYPGIYDDKWGGMTHLGNIVRDGWVFGLIPETESCAGWNFAAMQVLYDKVAQRWEAYGYQVVRLPEELRARHERIHREAVERARALGWNPDEEEEDG